MRRGIDATRDGTFRVRLPADERDVLAALPGQLREALDGRGAALYRLFPPAYADDDAGERGVRATRRREPARRASCARSSSSSGRPTRRRSPRTTSARWLGALESLRLVLGTQLDVTEESYGPLDATDPDAPRLALYHWLSWLQEEVVQALSTTLPRRAGD